MDSLVNTNLSVLSDIVICSCLHICLMPQNSGSIANLHLQMLLRFQAMTVQYANCLIYRLWSKGALSECSMETWNEQWDK